ncbi:beta strand repeat-containing protein [Lentzea fradiae]|nr:chaplin family protein [Lentzea fradiae]
MLGTGIASAQENVDPDAAPSPIDVGASIPVKADQNSVSVPGREVNVPKVDRTVSTDRVTSAVPTRAAAPAANPLIRQTNQQLQGTAFQHTFRGNRIQGHLDVPVDVCGNAVAAGGNSQVSADCTQYFHRDGTIVTDGKGQSLAGNVVAVDHVLPVQVTGNAIAVGGTAIARTDAEQVSTTGGDITTSGEKGAISGNVLAERGATPVQATGNGIGVVGIADTTSTADTFASSEGVVRTNGDNSTISGNAVPIPLAPLVELNGNAITAIGNATTDAVQSGAAYAGGKTHTSGDPATLAGNVIAPALAGPATVDDNAVAALGNALAISDTTNESVAGGETFTNGDGSTASGNVAGVPISLPVAAGGNGASAVGNALTDHSNEANSKAGGNVFTVGDNSVLSGNIADVPPATAIDACGNGATLAGQAAGTCENRVQSTTGGYQGTLGNDSVGSGNVAQTPLAVPLEAYALAAAVLGQSTGSADEVKDVTSSGAPNTTDDHGTVSSNIITTPAAAAPQVFAVTAGIVGNTASDASNDTSVTAGGSPSATGKKGSVAGNIVQVPTSTPAQVFGDGITLVGNNTTVADNLTDMKAGGNAVTTGERGSLAGNVISAPVATGTQVLGWSLGAGSNVNAIATNDLESVAGGKVHSNGDHGAVAGNLLGVQPAVLPAVPGNTVSLAGNTASDVFSDTFVKSGDDSTTSGEDASVSGNLLHAPVNVFAGVYANAVAVAGNATTVTDKISHTEAGGDMVTEGSGPLTAREMTVPVETTFKLARIPIEILGQATTAGFDRDVQLTGEDDGTRRATQLKGIQLPKGVDDLMKANEVPALNGLPVGGLLTGLPLNPLALAGKLPLPGLPGAGKEQRTTLPLNGGAAGITPNVEGLPVAGVLEGVKRLLPASVNEQAVPALSQAAVPAVTEKAVPALTQVAVPTLANQAVPALTQQVPVAKQRASLPLNGGTAGITPNVQGLPVAQVLDTVKRLIPAGVTQRSMPAVPSVPGVPSLPSLPGVPSLPVTAPALPLQVPGLPTERSLPTLPVGGPSVSGLNLNPTEGLIPAGERSLPVSKLPLGAPMAVLTGPARLFEKVSGQL